jgi:hypothetical protein
MKWSIHRRTAMNRAQYQVYVDHFNNKRYEPLVSYFAPDITVEYYDDATYKSPPARTLYGRDGFIANYKALHEHTKEVLEVGDFMVHDKLMFVELYTEFLTFRDPPTGFRGDFKKGDVRIMTNWVIYNLDENDKMKRIRIAHFRMHDPKTAKYKV